MEPTRDEVLARVELRTALERALESSGDARLEAILESSAPRAITRALPPIEAFYTFAMLDEPERRVLLRLVSDEQLDYLLDLDLWEGDRIDPERALDWLERLWGADQDLAAAWLHRAEPELVTALLKAHCTVTEGPSASAGEVLTEKGDVLPPFTAEGVYYISFHSERAADLLRGPLILWAGLDLERYLAQMTSLVAAIASDVTEKAYAQRWRRLRDEGWVPSDEAYEIYRWPTKAELEALEREVSTTPATVEHVDDGAPATLALVEKGGPIAEAFSRLDPDRMRRVLGELVTLSTRVITADHHHLADIDAHRAALEKTMGFVAIGLHQVGRREPSAAAETLATQGPSKLFRLGAARIADLGRRAVALRRMGWLSQVGVGVEILDEPLADVVLALARPRPRFPAAALDGAEEDRDFRTLEDVEICELTLGRVEMLGRLFLDGLGLDLAAPETFDLEGCHPGDLAELTLGMILRTAVAQTLLGGRLAFEPVAAGDLDALVLRARDVDEGALTADLRGVLVERLPDATPDEKRHFRDFVEENVASLRAALAGIDLSSPVDPRFVGTIVVRDARK